MAAEFMRITVKLPLCLKAFVHLDALTALQLFPLPALKSPVEETNRTDPYSGRTIPGDDIAWVKHSRPPSAVWQARDHYMYTERYEDL